MALVVRSIDGFVFFKKKKMALSLYKAAIILKKTKTKTDVKLVYAIEIDGKMFQKSELYTTINNK